MNPNDPSETGTYAAGMPFTQRRGLAAREIAAIQAQAARASARAGLFALIVTLCIVVPPVAASSLPDSDAFSLLFVAGVAAATFGGIAAWRSLRRSLAYRRDARKGYVLFHAYRDEDEAGNPTERRVEILPASGAVWSMDGQPTPRPVALLPTVQVATVPGIASIAAQWLQPLPSDSEDAPEVLANRRALSASELREVARHRRTLIWNGWFLLYAFDLCYVGILWREFASAPYDVDKVVYFAAVTIGLLCCHRRPLRQLRLARRMARDIAHGSAVILRYAPVPEMQNGEAAEAAAPFEVLPFSHVLWTVEGQPAPWRTVRW